MRYMIPIDGACDAVRDRQHDEKFVAALVLHFVERGDLALDDPVARYLPPETVNKIRNWVKPIEACIRKPPLSRGTDPPGSTRGGPVGTMQRAVPSSHLATTCDQPRNPRA